MRTLSRIITGFFMTLTTSFALAAGPNVSGGTPETTFQHDREAFAVVLQSDAVIALENKGHLRAIVRMPNRDDVYLVSTEKCELHMEFKRECDFSGELPQCRSWAKSLPTESRGDCKR